MTSAIRFGSASKQRRQSIDNNSSEPRVTMPEKPSSTGGSCITPHAIETVPVSSELQQKLDTTVNELGDFSDHLATLPFTKATLVDEATVETVPAKKHNIAMGAFNDNIDSLSMVMNLYHQDTKEIKKIAESAISEVGTKEQEIHEANTENETLKEQLKQKTAEAEKLQKTLKDLLGRYKAGQDVITTGGKLLEQYSKVLNPALVSYIHHITQLEEALINNPNAAGGGQMIARAVLKPDGNLSQVELKSKALAGDKSKFHELMVPSNFKAILEIKEALRPLADITETFQKTEKTFEDIKKPSKATESK